MHSQFHSISDRYKATIRIFHGLREDFYVFVLPLIVDTDVQLLPRVCACLYILSVVHENLYVYECRVQYYHPACATPRSSYDLPRSISVRALTQQLSLRRLWCYGRFSDLSRRRQRTPPHLRTTKISHFSRCDATLGITSSSIIRPTLYTDI